MKSKRSSGCKGLRFVDRKTGKHLSNRTLSHMASVSRLAHADLAILRRPYLNVGIGSLFPVLDADIPTKIRLARLRKRFKEVEVQARGPRCAGFRTEWQFYLLSDDGARELLIVFLKYNHPRKLKLLFFCNWLAQSISDQRSAVFEQLDQLCPAFSVNPPASSSIRKLLSSEKPSLYFHLVPSRLNKKVAR